MRHNGKRIAYKSFAGDWQLYTGETYGNGTPIVESCNCEPCRTARRKSITEHMERAGRA
jgi:hypothetical protein